MSEAREEHAVAREAMKAHDELLKLLHELEDLAARWEAGPPDPEQLGDDGRVLNEFRQLMLAHMDMEEREGLVHDILQVSPRHKHEVDRIVAQHEEFAGLLDELTREVFDPAVVQEERRRRFIEHLRRLITGVRAHEAHETDLVQRVYYRDLGALD